MEFPDLLWWERLKAAVEAAEAATELTPAQADDVRRAIEQYATDDLEFDDNPVVSEAEHGTWVSAWVWVAHGTRI